MTLHGGSLVERELDLPVCVVLITEKRVECARPQFPFTRASSAGLAGERTAACLRLAEPSSAGTSPATPARPSNAANPKGRVVGCPGGSLRGAGQAAPLGSPGRRKAWEQSAGSLAETTLRHYPVIPAQAGIQRRYQTANWIPAFAGMTWKGGMYLSGRNSGLRWSRARHAVRLRKRR